MFEQTTTRHNELIDPLLHVWGWEIPVYLFLGGLVAGMMILTGYFQLTKPARRMSCVCARLPLIGLVLLTLGMLALFLDLEHKPVRLAPLHDVRAHLRDVVGQLDPDPGLPGAAREPVRQAAGPLRGLLPLPRQRGDVVRAPPGSHLPGRCRQYRPGDRPRHLHRNPARVRWARARCGAVPSSVRCSCSPASRPPPRSCTSSPAIQRSDGGWNRPTRRFSRSNWRCSCCS